MIQQHMPAQKLADDLQETLLPALLVHKAQASCVHLQHRSSLNCQFFQSLSGKCSWQARKLVQHGIEVVLVVSFLKACRVGQRLYLVAQV